MYTYKCEIAIDTSQSDIDLLHGWEEHSNELENLGPRPWGFQGESTQKWRFKQPNSGVNMSYPRLMVIK
jgi:hypothetical protein